MPARLRVTCLTAAILTPIAAGQVPKPPAEPRAFAAHPFAIPRGAVTTVAIRGVSLQQATALTVAGEGVSARVVKAEAEPVAQGEPPPATPVDRVVVEFNVAPAAAEGSRAFRVVTSQGVSNEIPIRVASHDVADEAAAKDGALARFPATVAGRLERRGETDLYWIEAEAGQELTFEAFSGHGPFDPGLALLEPSGSWFDPKRLNRIAFNDEPLFFPGLATDARLTHRFAKAGKYALQVRAFSGQGGPDFVYELRISPGAAPTAKLHPKRKPGWDERTFTRGLSRDWIEQVARRGGGKLDPAGFEVYRATPTTVVKLPAVVEGRIDKPGAVDRVRVPIDKAQDLVIEIETPDVAMPLFTPVVRLVEPSGLEVVTSLYTKRNNNGLYMMKMVQPKTTVAVRAPGDYFLEIRDITQDRAGLDYRVMIRPRIPHIGRVEVQEDRIHLRPGESKKLTIIADREEDYDGTIAITAEGLPPGVSAIPAADPDPERPPLPNGGKLERYTPKQQRTVLLLMAAPDAQPTPLPVVVRVVVRPVVDGKVAEAVEVREVPVMVLKGAS